MNVNTRIYLFQLLIILHYFSSVDSKNITNILNSLVQNYDKRLRPNYGGPPVEVGITMFISTISAVSEVEMDFTLDMYLRQYWTDPRLMFNGTNDLSIGIEMINNIWVPDTFFPNEKRSFFHISTTHNSFLRIRPTGEVLRSLRLTVTTMCPMDLIYFPLDSQNCSLEIESYGYSMRDIVYYWRHGENQSVSVSREIHLAQFKVGERSYAQRMIVLSTGNYSRLSAFFTFHRNIGFYLIQIYLPSSLIVIISWVSFWLNREATQARVAIGVTTVLTMTTLMTSTNAAMPKVSYVKSIDLYLGTCFIIVFASLLEYAAVGYMMKQMRTRKEQRDNNITTSYYAPLDRRHSSASKMNHGNNNQMGHNLVVNSTAGTVSTNLGAYSAIPQIYDHHHHSYHQQRNTPPSHSPHHRGAHTNFSGQWTPQTTRSTLSPQPFPLNLNNLNRNSLPGGRGLGPPDYPYPHSPHHYSQPSHRSSFTMIPTQLPPECDCDIEQGTPGQGLRPIRLPPQAYSQGGSGYGRSRTSGRRATSFRPSSIDKYSRIFFPLSFVSFHLIYWTVYLNASELL